MTLFFFFALYLAHSRIDRRNSFLIKTSVLRILEALCQGRNLPLPFSSLPERENEKNQIFLRLSIRLYTLYNKLNRLRFIRFVPLRHEWPRSPSPSSIKEKEYKTMTYKIPLSSQLLFYI